MRFFSNKAGPESSFFPEDTQRISDLEARMLEMMECVTHLHEDVNVLARANEQVREALRTMFEWLQLNISSADTAINFLGHFAEKACELLDIDAEDFLTEEELEEHMKRVKELEIKGEALEGISAIETFVNDCE